MQRAVVAGNRIFQALADPSRHLRVAHAWRSGGEGPHGWDGTMDCRFIEIEANRKLSYTWKMMGEKLVDLLGRIP